jgi:hypothetical protein
MNGDTKLLLESGWRAKAHAIQDMLADRAASYLARFKYFRELKIIIDRCKSTKSVVPPSFVDQLSKQQTYWIEWRWRVVAFEQQFDKELAALNDLESKAASKLEKCGSQLGALGIGVDMNSDKAQQCLLQMVVARLNLAKNDAEWAKIERDWIANLSERAKTWERRFEPFELQWRMWIKSKMHAWAAVQVAACQTVASVPTS